MKRASVLVVLVVSLLACGGGSELAGEWELLDPGTGAALGETMTLNEDQTWSRNGTPSYEGTYKWASEGLSLHIEKLNGESREAAIATAVAAGQPKDEAEERFNELDAHMKFELASEDGAALLKQLDPPGSSPSLVFRKREED